MAHELKQSLNELMGWSGSLTHRQFVVWKKWLHDDWEQPSRTDRYIQRLTYIVDNMFTKQEDLPPEDNYRLKYERTTAHKPQPTQPKPQPQQQSSTSSQEADRIKDFIGDADPSTIVDASSDDEHWKKQRRVLLAWAGIKTDKDGNVIRKDSLRKPKHG